MSRILMVSTHGYFEANPVLGLTDTGGQVVFVIELAKALAQLGHAVDILTRQFSNLAPVEKVNDYVRIVRIPCGGREFIPKEYLVQQLPELVQSFIQHCRRNNLRYQFIDCHYWDAGFVGIKLGKQFSIPVIFTPHSLGIWKENLLRERAEKENKPIDEGRFEEKYNFQQRNKTEKQIMAQADKIVATTVQQKEIITNDYQVESKKIVVIPPGFDAEKFDRLNPEDVPSTVDQTNIPDKFILAVGRTARNKGYDLLIKAFKPVADARPDLSLVLAIGSKEPTKDELAQRREYTDLAERLGLTDKIIFLGYVKNLNRLYNKALVSVLPSTYEPFGITAIEAMACGTPTVITTWGGLKDFFRDGQETLMANPLNTDQLADKILTLLNDKKLRQTIAENAYQKVRLKFLWSKIAAATLAAVS